MRGLGSIPMLAAVLAALGGCGGDEPIRTPVDSPSDAETSFLDDPCDRQGAERRKLFHVTDAGFAPKRVVVQSGAPVTFYNCGTGVHTVTKASGRGEDFDSGALKPREKFDRTFVSVGTHRVVDQRNPKAQMIIEVEGFEIEPQG